MEGRGYLCFAIAALLVLSQFSFCAAKLRWCTDGKFQDELQNLTQYNDEEQVCMECKSEEKLLELGELSRHECCDGEVRPVGVCSPESLLHSCNEAPKCDNKRQCYDGRDEMGCFGCGNESFSCAPDSEGNRCIPIEKVCDSKKDCIDGKDETLCPYYGGWCDGFLCGGKHKECIDSSKICDGNKDCVDGSDETNCQYCLNQFRCHTLLREDINANSANCVGLFRICNGDDDCGNGADEVGCYFWQDWSAWSECGAETESCTRIRRRSCADSKNVIVSSTRCTENETDINENHIDICPECLVPEDPTVTTEAEEGNTERNQSNGLPFSTGALAGIIVAGSLLAIGIIVAIAIGVLGSLGRTGFWRPASKLPGPTGSSVPGVGTTNNNRIKPTERVTNPYADDAENGRVNGIVSSRNAAIPRATEFLRTIG